MNEQESDDIVEQTYEISFEEFFDKVMYEAYHKLYMFDCVNILTHHNLTKEECLSLIHSNFIPFRMFYSDGHDYVQFNQEQIVNIWNSMSKEEMNKCKIFVGVKK